MTLPEKVSHDSQSVTVFLHHLEALLLVMTKKREKNIHIFTTIHVFFTGCKIDITKSTVDWGGLEVTLQMISKICRGENISLSIYHAFLSLLS